jgi:hypothetical protein
MIILVQAMMQMMCDDGVHDRFWLSKTHVMFTTPFQSFKND